MTIIEVSVIENASYPVSVFMSDIYKNNESLIGVISSDPSPGVVIFDTTIPSILQTANQILITMIDSNGCEVMKLFDCDGEVLVQILIT